MAAQRPADGATRLQRYSSGLPDAGLRRGSHRAEQQSPSHHSTGWAAAHLLQHSPVPGDSRGRWEGETLVVETRNFTDKTRFRGSNEALHVVERFTRVDADTILYEFTVDDPTSWTSSWSAEVPMVKVEGPMFEYGCHEGNYDLPNILGIARNLEKQAAKKAAAGTDSR